MNTSSPRMLTLADLTFHTRAFQALDLEALYAIMQLRQAVFVVEQNCPYLDADGKDAAAYHLGAYGKGGELLAYARLFDKGVVYSDYASIGRVIVAPQARGIGLGNLLMRQAATQLYQYFGRQAIKISAQAHLQPFYGRLGYEGVGEEYLEDDIPHRAMICPA